MRIKIIEQKILKYDELSERAQQHVREKFAEWFAEDFDPNRNYDCECWIDLQEHSIKSYKIGSWGTNPVDTEFSEIDLDLDKLIARMSESLRDQRNLYRIARAEYFHGAIDSLLQVSTRRARGFGGGYITTIEFDSLGSRARIESLCEKYADKITDHVKDCEHKIARAISAEFDHVYSEEYARDMCDANEYEFDESGDLA